MGCTIHIASDTVTIAAPGGKVVLRDEEERSSSNITSFLGGCDGRRSVDELCLIHQVERAEANAVLAALHEVAGIADAQHVWRWFAAAASNPPIFRAPMNPADAYALPRWRPTATTSKEPLPPWPEGPTWERRRSLDLTVAAVTEPEQFPIRLGQLAAETMRPDDYGHLRFPSAGAMWPLQMWTIAAEGGGSTTPRLVDWETGTWTRGPHRTLEHLVRCFLPDTDLIGALSRGAGLIIISADPSRTTAKYGDRGWQYALMECGAALQTLTYLADALGLATRPIGGYQEAEVTHFLGEPGTVPMCTLVVADK